MLASIDRNQILHIFNVGKKLKLEEIAEVKEKKRALEKHSIDAERKSDLSLLAKVNSFWVTNHFKKEALSILGNAFSKLNEEIKHI